MKILLIGDIVGKPGRKIVQEKLIALREQHQLDCVIANCENASHGAGITTAIADDLFRAGVDGLTSGNHVWRNKEAHELLDRDFRIIRPANYPDEVSGKGATVIETLNGKKVGIINVMGRVFMQPVLDCPFRAVERELEVLKKETSVIILDIHAEATSEKVALGWYFDGKVSCIFGTHTHIPTADERILPKGTGYLTDVGMTGPYDSVIGREVPQIMQKFLTGIGGHSDVAVGNVQLRGLIVDVDETTGKTLKIERITETLDV